MFVESMVVNICQFTEIEDTHTAADVNAHDIWDYLVSEVTGKSYNAPCTSVNVGHNPYLLIGKHID